MVDVASPGFKRDPFRVYRRLRAEAPVCEVRAGRWRIWLVTRYNDAAALLKDERFVKH